MKNVDMTNIYTQKGIFFFHDNSQCNGTAIHFSVAHATEFNMGALIVTFAPQTIISSKRHACQFDWDRNTFVHLDVTETAKILQVLRGEIENIDFGKGLNITDTQGHKIFQIEHQLDPIPNYHISLVFRPYTSDEDEKISISLSPSEGLALAEILSHALYSMTMGD